MISPQNGANAAPSRRLQHNPEVRTAAAAHKHVRAGKQEEVGLALSSCPFLALLAEIRREGKASLLTTSS